MQHGGPSVASLEIIGNGVLVQVNGKCYQKSTCVHLRGGDEVIFSVSGKHSYVSFLEWCEKLFPKFTCYKFMLFITFLPFKFSGFSSIFLNDLSRFFNLLKMKT